MKCYVVLSLLFVVFLVESSVLSATVIRGPDGSVITTNGAQGLVLAPAPLVLPSLQLLSLAPGVPGGVQILGPRVTITGPSASSAAAVDQNGDESDSGSPANDDPARAEVLRREQEEIAAQEKAKASAEALIAAQIQEQQAKAGRR